MSTKLRISKSFGGSGKNNDSQQLYKLKITITDNIIM